LESFGFGFGFGRNFGFGMCFGFGLLHSFGLGRNFGSKMNENRNISNLTIICCNDSQPFLSDEILRQDIFFLPNIKMYKALAYQT
jgi:hypothetical protein